MKRLTLFCLLLGGLTYSLPSQAQFFKKLKKTVSNTVNNVSSEINGDDNAGANATGGTYTVKATHADLSTFDPTTLYTLQMGETFDFSESCLLLHADLAIPQIIIKKGDNRYKILQGGQHVLVTGKNTAGCMVNGNDINDHHLMTLQAFIDAASDNSAMQQDNELNKYIRMSIMGKGGPGTYIDFNNKSYGPFQMVTSMILDKSKSKFKAIVMPSFKDDDDDNDNDNDNDNDVGMHFSLISSDGENIPLPYTYMCYFLNKNYNHPLIEGVFLNDANHTVIYDPGTKQKIRVIHDQHDVKFDKYNGALIYAGNGKVYIDEQLVKTFPPDIQVIPEHVYVGKDHSHWAVWTTNGLQFYNNVTIDGVLSCKMQIKEGREILSWIVLGKDNKTLFLCHAEL